MIIVMNNCCCYYFFIIIIMIRSLKDGPQCTWVLTNHHVIKDAATDTTSERVDNG